MGNSNAPASENQMPDEKTYDVDVLNKSVKKEEQLQIDSEKGPVVPIACMDHVLLKEGQNACADKTGSKEEMSSPLVTSSKKPLIKEDDTWVQPAIELWVKRALKAIQVVNRANDKDCDLPIEKFECRLSIEAKKSNKLRPNGIPDEKTYIKKTIKGLRKDHRLRWEKKEGVGIVYWKNKMKNEVDLKENKDDASTLATESNKTSTANTECYDIAKSVKSISCTFEEEVTPQRPQEASSKKSTELMYLVTVQRRIEILVSRLSPLNMCNLPEIYKREYHDALVYKAFGFNRLTELVDAIPSVCIHSPTSGSPSYLVLNHNNLRKPLSNDETVAESNSSDRQMVNHSKLSTEAGQKRSTTYVDPPDQAGSSSVTPIKSSALYAAGGAGPVVRETNVSSVPTNQSFYQVATMESDNDYNSENGSQFVNPAKIVNTARREPGDLLDSLYENSRRGVIERVALGDKLTVSSFRETSVLGHLSSPNEENFGEPVFLNTHEPFCLSAIGVQGSGKSHTLACVLESCLVSSGTEGTICLQKPMTALVLHYDQNTTSVCEAAGLLSPSAAATGTTKQNDCCVPRSKSVILVSPAFYKQRKAFYGDYCTVCPLLFKWNTLTADHLKRIMRIGPDDNQLYVASFMTLLRRYQRQGVVPDFAQFIQEVRDVCSIKGQQGPLDQRLALLSSVVAESDENKEISGDGMDLIAAVASDLNLIIADLTDPLLSKEEANSLFQVITEQFRTIPVQGGKVLALDEAHKFMDGTAANDGLSEAIVNVARLMRHDGMRLVVSTQSPKALAPELLELVSVAVLHQFHSQDWFAYLRKKLPLSEDAWDSILSLGPGHAMVFAPRSAVASESHVIELVVRPRLTADFGASKTNK
eukprot:scaffold3574_cov49-Attheya_sp.AAC.6